MTSIKDVAREVGMSTATVSRALRGLPRVSEDTRSRVLEAARRLNYVASPHASSLASGRTRAVGVVVPFVTRWYFAAVIHGTEGLLRGAGYDLLLYNLAGDAEARERVFSGHLLRKRVDAVLVLSLTPDTQEVASLAGLGLPVAIVGGSVEGWSSVRVDDVETAGIAVRHLLALGHRRIAFVGGGLEQQLDFVAPRERLLGYEQTMAAAGLPVDPAWVVPSDFTTAGGVRAAESLLALEPRPTAVFAASDEMAIGVIHGLTEAGLRVPEDVSVVGIDDHEMAEYFGLTTVAQPVHEQGRIAARLLLDEIAAGGTRAPSQVTVPTHLVVRRTTAPPRA